MNMKKLVTSIGAAAMAAAMAATPVFAAGEDIYLNPAVTKDTIDTDMKGSITIFKLRENDGTTSEGDGLYNEDETRDGMANIIFTRKKIADFAQPGGNNEVGTYFNNLDAGFYALVNKIEVSMRAAGALGSDEYILQGTKITSPETTAIEVVNITSASDAAASDIYYTTEQLETAMKLINAWQGEGTYDNWEWTGETAATDYILDGGTNFNATGTDPEGNRYDSIIASEDANQLKGATTASDLDLGLYMIAETGYFDTTSNSTVMYDRVAGEKTNYANSAWTSDGSQTAADSDSGKATSTKGVNSSIKSDDTDYNYADYDSSVEEWNKINDAEDNQTVNADNDTQNPVVVDNPTSPFLVSVPTTNVTDLTSNGTTYQAGVVWQYNVAVYPKDSTTTIAKKVVADDGDTLVERQDYAIGQNIHQVIYSDVPATMWNRTNTQYEVHDEMSSGLTFQKVTRVAYAQSKISDPDSLSEFDAGTNVIDFDSADYTITYNLVDGSSVTATADEAADYNYLNSLAAYESGSTANMKFGLEAIQSFDVKLTSSGLAKLDALDVAGQVIVEFDSVLNANAVIGSADGWTNNVNKPTLTWRNSNSLTRKVEGNEVKVYTYALDLLKTGKDIIGSTDANGKVIDESHEFDASEVGFTFVRHDQYDADLDADDSVDTKDMTVRFVKEADGVYHVWTPTDGTIKEVISMNDDGSDKVTTVNADGDLTVYEVVRPAATGNGAASASYTHKNGSEDMTFETSTGDTTAAGATASTNEQGHLILLGLDSERYTVTEKSTSAYFNLLKSTYDIRLNAQGYVAGEDNTARTEDDYVQDGTLIENAASDYTIDNVGAALVSDNGVVPLAHDAGVVTMNVENYKTLTLHTGSRTAMLIYLAAGAMAAATAVVIVVNKKKQREEA